MITFTPLSVPYAPSPLNDHRVKGNARDNQRCEGSSGATVKIGNGPEIERPQALAYLLELDDIKVLIDCGGTEDFSFPKASPNSLRDGQAKRMEVDEGSEEGEQDIWEGKVTSPDLQSSSLDTVLSRIGASIDLVLLSHSTLAHLGSLAWARSHYGLTCPIFATLPTQTMGRLTVLEMVQCLRDATDVDLEMRLAAEIDAGKIHAKENDQATAMGSNERPEAPLTSKPPRTPLSALHPGGAFPFLEDGSHLSALGAAGGMAEPDEEVEEAAIKSSADKALAYLLDADGSKLLTLRQSLATSTVRRRVPTVEQVEQTFDSISTLRYLQPYHFSHGNLAGLTLTAYNAGHSLGGTVWKLRSPSQGTIVIAMEWNHNRERHLDGSALLSTSGGVGSNTGASGQSGSVGGSGSSAEALRRADLMITSVQRGLITNIRRKDRDAAILDIVHRTLQAGASVLFPIDPSARLLELLVLLDQHWAYAYSHARFPLCLVSHTGSEVIERARTLMEWMTREWATVATGAGANAEAEGVEGQDGDPGLKNNTQRKGNDRRARERMQKEGPAAPLDFKYLRIFSSLEAMNNAIPPGQARVVLAVPPSLTCGPARKLVATFSQNPQDVILLTQRGEPGSLTRWLWNEWHKRQQPAAKLGRGKVGQVIKTSELTGDSAIESHELEIQRKISLNEEELKVYEDALQAAKTKAAQRRALAARSRRRLEADEDEDSDDDSDADENFGNDEFGALPSATRGASGGAGGLGRKRDFDSAFEVSGAVDRGAMGDSLSAEVSFDIYLKGDASKVTSFFGSRPDKGEGDGAAEAGVRYRMFPFVDKKRRIDAYGETIDVNRWLSKKNELEANQAEGKADEEALEAQRNRAWAQKGTQDGQPSKFVVDKVQLHLQCHLAFVEMEGLNDGRALKTVLPQLLPRRLIMVDGDAATRRDMRSSLQSVKAMSKELWAPLLGFSVSIGESTVALTVNLGDNLMKSIRLSQFEDFEIAYLRSVFKISEESSLPTLNSVEQQTASAGRSDEGAQIEEGAEGEEPGEFKASPEEPVRVASKTILPTIFVGDLRLSGLKSHLAGKMGMPADFAGEGLLVCGLKPGSTDSCSATTVQKAGQGRIVIEGNIGQNFYNVREQVYSLHAQISSNAA
ncbi:hypothetical protein K437DRAFT_254952 [Tilletiaria anomala UBC 951]|uniref:Cleavage and polyadenylation specificity factor subunit 2 n=1 Tax=Tilletiaria anomala (strain ATCC 24038 / CBS 436.72 / UBC 951) TaxID=1037660 RepID=A0A066WBS0_TILAU|nr:uncharacterized protein K437DRAFT_254952 [Tilletiaria anomala UBC 951]KDN51357.1 hypothetical protein K437DRAFT_254952 [Tilletiaria anomala UBC 951]